jgi:DNA primase
MLAEKAGELVGTIAIETVAAKPDEGACALLKKALHVLVALDFDGPGARAWPWWRENIRDCVRWPVPKGKDPGEAFELGVDIREWVRAGLPRGLR